jgi:3-deoxy-D-manno-octulosonate 8-phosphate phosphatase (KDO 8-P phosphatase)
MPTDRQLAEPIRLILSDVDGVLTDGRIIYNDSGVETKSFHVRDGLGIKLWQRCGYHFGIVTSRTSHAVKLRAQELRIEVVRQGVEDKWQAAAEILQSLKLSPAEACYIGDDLPDVAPMRRLGLTVAVADAADDVRGMAHWTTRLGGGAGAVRELIERLLKAKGEWEDSLAT